MIPNGLSGSASHVAVEDIVSWWYEHRATAEQLADQPEPEVDPDLEALLQPDEDVPEDGAPQPEDQAQPSEGEAAADGEGTPNP